MTEFCRLTNAMRPASDAAAQLDCALSGAKVETARIMANEWCNRRTPFNDASERRKDASGANSRAYWTAASPICITTERGASPEPSETWTSMIRIKSFFGSIQPSVPKAPP